MEIAIALCWRWRFHEQEDVPQLFFQGITTDEFKYMKL
jgi:hypothetical protein